MTQGQGTILLAAARRLPRRHLTEVLLLMTGAALTEGLGILLLVPLLADLGGHGQALTLPAVLANLLPASLEARLALFVMLIALRSALVHRLTTRRGQLQLEFVDGLRRDCHAAMTGAEWRWLARKRVADRNAALLGNAASAGIGLDQTIGLTATAISLMFLLALSVLLSWQATVIAAAGGILLLLLLRRFRRAALNGGFAVGDAQRIMYREFDLGLSGLRSVKMHGTEAALARQFEAAMAGLRRAKLNNQQASALSSALIQPLGAAALALTAYGGLRFGGLTLAELIPQLVIMARIVPAVERVQQGWSQVLHAIPAYTEIIDLTEDGQRNAEPRQHAMAAPELKQELRLDRITVTYADRARAALDDVSLTVPAGSTIALTGPSGAGKSTMADVIAGLIIPDRGVLLIDGMPLQPEQRAAWRHRVAYVEQTPLFAHASIRENLQQGRTDWTDAMLNTALLQASASFASGLPDGLDTVIGDGGLRLSGGERQRLALARCLLQQPQILVLDEATSALDAQNESAVVAAIGQLRGTLTMILISHRPALLALADHCHAITAGRLGAGQAA